MQGLTRSAQPGDWPWHAALLRAHVHACDAALVHPAWLVTTASCFQVTLEFFLTVVSGKEEVFSIERVVRGFKLFGDFFLALYRFLWRTN